MRILLLVFAMLAGAAVLAPGASAAMSHLGDVVADCKAGLGAVQTLTSGGIVDVIICVQQGCIEIDEPCTRECNELHHAVVNTGRAVSDTVEDELDQHRIGDVWDALDELL